MKWRKLLELSTSSSPPGQRSRMSQSARRRAMFEALENRKMFAADLAEITTAELQGSEPVASEEVLVRSVELSAEQYEEKAELTELVIDPATMEFDPLIAYPEIMLMTFRGSESPDGLAESSKTLELIDESELDSSLAYMTGNVDLSATSAIADETADIVIEATIDDVISEDDLIFYTMGPSPEVETSSLEEDLLAEDVNGDGDVTALDMLLVINALNSYGALPVSQVSELAAPSSSLTSSDINRDGYVTPLDALLLANFFNQEVSIDAVASEQDALAAISISRIRNPVEDAPAEETTIEDLSAPLIEEKSGDEFWEQV